MTAFEKLKITAGLLQENLDDFDINLSDCLNQEHLNEEAKQTIATYIQSLNKRLNRMKRSLVAE